MFILGASAWALSRGVRALPARTEALLHVGCILGGVGAFLGFYLRCSDINGDGYNAATESEAQENAVIQLNQDDDKDDDMPSAPARARFESARTQYDALEQRMLEVWMGLLAVAVGMWIVLRWSYRRTLMRWHEARDRMAEKEATDEWASTRRSQWAHQWELTTIQRNAYVSVAKPLEPFVLVFILFGAPGECQRSASSLGPICITFCFFVSLLPSS
jgi:hypothetical protein